MHSSNLQSHFIGGAHASLLVRAQFITFLLGFVSVCAERSLLQAGIPKTAATCESRDGKIVDDVTNGVGLIQLSMRRPEPKVDMHDSFRPKWMNVTERTRVSALPLVGTGIEFCPHGFVKPDYDELKKRVLDGPVQAGGDEKPSQNITQKQYVFITGMPFTGTTGLLGLVSTSPEVTNLCNTNGTACEGSCLLFKEHIATLDHPRDPLCRSDEPPSTEYCWKVRDWTKGLKSFHKYWDAGKQILVDKSPDYQFDLNNMYDQLHKTVNLSFIYLLSSPCYSSYSLLRWDNSVFLIRDEIAALRAKGARIKIVRAEDLLGDPYGVVNALLEFIPELVSLDPTQTGVHDAPLTGVGQSRARSLLQFVLDQENNTHRLNQCNFPANMIEAFADLGYTKDWFASRPWFAT